MIKSFGLLILRLSIGTMLIHHGYEKTADNIVKMKSEGTND